MSTGPEGSEECSRCGREIPVDDAAMLIQDNNKALWRIMCPECLKEIGVPQGYHLKRDLSYRHQGGSPERTQPDGDTDDSETPVLADFRGKAITEEMSGDELSPARIVMSDGHLILVTEAHRTVIPVPRIQDVDSGQGSDHTREFFDDVLRIAYKGSQGDTVAFVAGSRENLDRFTPLLFKSLLSGSGVRYKHPVNVGGQPRTPPKQSGVLAIQNDGFRTAGTDSPVEIPRDSVIHVHNYHPDWYSGEAGVLRVSTSRDGRTVVSEFGVSSSRTHNLLARFLHLEYGTRKSIIKELALGSEELRLLIRLYSLGNRSKSLSPGNETEAVSSGDPTVVNDLEQTSQGAVLENLEGKGLVAVKDGEPHLTTKGLVAVFQRFDEVL